MQNNHSDWEDLGRNIQDIVDRAVNSRDYRQLNETIRQVVDMAMGLGGEAFRKVRSTLEESPPPSRQASSPLPQVYGNTSSMTLSGILQTVLGGIGSFLSLVSTLALVGWNLQWGLFLGWNTTLPLIMLGLCGGVTTLGIRKLSRLGRFRIYRRILGEKTHCSLTRLASAVGKQVAFVRKEVLWMCRKGLFLEGQLNYEGTELITSAETFRHYETSRLQMQERQRLEQVQAAQTAHSSQTPPPSPAADPQLEQVLARGETFIREIRRCNDAIPGEEISEKIDRMEQIVRTIFTRAKEHPQIVPDLQRMMDYYLPMTIKLLNAYADMDAQPSQGQTIQTSKREIEAALDTLNQAFEKLLDDLFRDTAMDVSSDISVLTTLLAQEGLTQDEFEKIKTQTPD